MKQAHLYCTIDCADAEASESEAKWLGIVTDEGSMRDLIESHCGLFGDDHADHIHLIVEGTPEYVEASEYAWFPHFLAPEFERAVLR